MRLKRLTLHGFKTFADKTTIEFSNGVTAIVGPNGSGKSNLLDALTWCLGEQKASSLRASRAQDVIFAGSSSRKLMGMAEVSLTVDNEDRFLPLEFAEVTVTRRIYRSGDSEYLINRVPCRLKDITDLFLDTGVGRGSYAIVNQSEIDAVLSSRTEDRRELFEEAAGIKRYRVKKREAQRKLDHTEENLVRVHDILGELSTVLAPLESQAEAARTYLSLTARLRAVEVGQLAWDYKRLQDDLAGLTQAAGVTDSEKDLLSLEAARLEQSATTMGQRIVDAEAEIERARLTLQTVIAEGNRLDGQIALGAERRASAERTIETLESDLALLEEERDQLSAEATTQLVAAREATTQAEILLREVQQAESVVAEADRALVELTRLVRGQEADYLELARRLSSQKAELAAVRTRMAQRAIDITDTDERATIRSAEARAATEGAVRLSQAVEEAHIALAKAREDLANDCEPNLRRTSDLVASLSESKTVAERRRAEQLARLNALEETESAQEGYYAGVRSVTRASASGKLVGRFVVVANALRAPQHLDTALEVALSGSLQDIITDTQADAKSAIAYLNETRSGRATFLPLDSLRDQEVPDALRRAAKQHSGVLGSGADLVAHDADVARAIRVLLARVLFVEDLDTATEIVRHLGRGDWSKIVTIGGEVVVPSGAITGGAQGRPGPNLLGRKREIAALKATTSAAAQAIDRLNEQISSAKRERDAAAQAVREAEIQIATARDATVDADRRQQAIDAEAQRLRSEAEGLRRRARQLEESGAPDTAREATLAAALAASDSIDEGALAARDDLRSRQAALFVRKTEAQATARASGTELASTEERARSLARAAERASEASLRAAMTAEERKMRAAVAGSVVIEEETQALARSAKREQMTASLAEASNLVDKWRESRQALVNENFQIGERIKDATRGAQRAGEQSQAARLRAARVEAQLEAVGQRLVDEYELHPESAVALTGGNAPDRDTTQEIGRLRREIKALGAVNTSAIEEYNRQSERVRFLTEQKHDLEAARSRLLGAMSEIDDSTRGVFLETYDAVNKAFTRLFSRLFGGGSAELALTDPDDILETGIDIFAQPPGKKRQNLALLSGGERALTATALLFAFLDVKPAPFCVLDEVDAPLDGANVEKFADLLRDFGTRSQFIVITHNATTMEAAPLWFGVTMQEPGISRAISMRVPESVNPKLEM